MMVPPIILKFISVFLAFFSIVSIEGAQGQRLLNFSGRTWSVKESSTPVGPGPNLFSGSPSDIWVDEEGLHLRIVQRNGKWYSSECVLQDNLGYGTYVIHTKCRVDILDPNMVFGLFTWDDGAPQHNYRELDFEFSRWGDSLDPTNSQYVVQPFGVPGNLTRYTVDLSPPRTEDLTLIMTWSPGKAEFWTYYGHHFPDSAPDEDLAASWFNEGPDVPPPGGENFRFNLWLVNGNPPQSNAGDEMVITDFFYLSPNPPTPADVLSIDRFEDGNLLNERKGLWSVFSGNDLGQSFSIRGELESPGFDNSILAYRAVGSLPGFSPSYNYGGVVTELSTDITNNPLDVSTFEFLVFDLRIDQGGPYQVRLEDATHTFNSTNVPISIDAGNEESVSIPLSAFEEGVNGVSLKSVQKIVWTLQNDGDEAPFGITIDNVAFTKGSNPSPTPTPKPAVPMDILIDDLEDGDFKNNLDGNWEVFDGNGICNPCGSVAGAVVHPGLRASDSALSATGSVPLAEGGFSFAGVVTRLGPTALDSLDLSSHFALEFDVRILNGGPYSVRLEDRAHVAAGFQGYRQPHFHIPESMELQRIRIPLVFFASGAEGVDLSEVANIVWAPTSSEPGDPFGLILDNVRIIASEMGGFSAWRLY